MSKFKVGSKVRVVENNLRRELTIGAEYTVAEDADDCVLLDGVDSYVHTTRLELVQTAPEVRTLKGDNKLVFKALSDGVSWSVSELEEFIKTHSNRQPTAATITARIRDLRKPIYGGFRIDRTQQGKNHFYKLVQGV